MAKAKHKNPEEKHEKILLEWEAPEFIKYDKSKTWYLVAGIGILVLIAYALYTNSATMAIVFLVLAGVYYLTHNQEPKMIDVQITELGVHAGNKFYPYNSIDGFWVVYDQHFVRTLNLRITNERSKVSIQLHGQDPAQVRQTLTGLEVDEVKGEHEGMLDTIIRLLKI